MCASSRSPSETIDSSRGRERTLPTMAENNNSPHTPALKEWAAIVHALATGEQVVDLRKGGLREDGRHFAVQSDRFYWYPTYEHQRADLVKPAYAHWVDTSEPADRSITVYAWAEVVATAELTEPQQVEAVAGKSIWSTEYATARLKWKSRDPLWVLLLRTYLLDTPITIPYTDAYGGCTSWVDLDGLPADPTQVPGAPALSDVAFEGRARGVRDALAEVGAPLIDR